MLARRVPLLLVSRDQGLGVCERVAARLAPILGWDAATTAQHGRRVSRRGRAEPALADRVSHQLLELFGIYGGALVIAFVAGMFPLVSIEVFLVGLTALASGDLTASSPCSCLIAAVGHQIAKTLCYFAGVGALEHGRIKPWVDRTRSAHRALEQASATRSSSSQRRSGCRRCT